MRLAVLSLIFLAACNSSSDDDSIVTPDSGTEVDAGEQPAVTYFRDIKPILDGRCVACHTTDGIGPIDLTVPAVAVEGASKIKAQVDSKLMPPWHASADCNSFNNNRSLTTEQIGKIDEWIDLGSPMGDPNVV